MQVKSTLRVIDQANVKPRGGVTDGQTLKPIVGFADTPTDRIRISVATYEPGTLEPLHWHPIEAFYYIISGQAVVRNIEGEEFHVGGGTGIYAPAGIAGAHEWEVKESLQLVSIRATTESDRKMQFTVDKETKRSYIDLEELANRGGLSFKSHY
jgi:mannose-6-phosphate isomerase-like protein (cupin superfamily)